MRSFRKSSRGRLPGSFRSRWPGRRLSFPNGSANMIGGLIFIVVLPGVVTVAEIALAGQVAPPPLPFLAGAAVVALTLIFYISLVITVGRAFRAARARVGNFLWGHVWWHDCRDDHSANKLHSTAQHGQDRPRPVAGSGTACDGRFADGHDSRVERHLPGGCAAALPAD